MKQRKLKRGGVETTNCIRCGRECRYGKAGEDVRFIKKAAIGKGRCAECTVAVALQRLANMHVEDTVGRGLPDCLRLPHIQEAFARVLKAGGSDMEPSQIDWERVIQVWSIDTETKSLF